MSGVCNRPAGTKIGVFAEIMRRISTVLGLDWTACAAGLGRHVVGQARFLRSVRRYGGSFRDDLLRSELTYLLTYKLTD